jgi:hypothetical protein
MKGAICFAVGTVVALMASAPALAQEKKEVQGYVAGGYSSPAGAAGDYTNGGWNVSGGVLLRPAPHSPFAVRFDLGYSYMGANNNALNVANSSGLRVDDGYMSLWNLTAEGLWEFGNPDHVGGWVGVGFGGYRRYLELTNTVIVPGYVCDPWWGWCYPAAVPGDVIQANDTLTKFGYSATAGINFAVGPGQMYIEGRYHWMDSTKYTEYYPILIGYRF